MATPKTESELLNNVFQDNQADGSITASDMRDFVASTRYLSPLGWEFRYDSQYTQGSPLTLTDGVNTGVTFTDNPGEDLRYPSTFPELWNQGTQRLDIAGFTNGFGIVRFSLLGTYIGGTIPHLDFSIDVGSDPAAPIGTGGDINIIYTGSQVFTKAGSGIQGFNWVIPLFGGADFVTNGGKFILKADGADVDVWQIAITAGATLVPNPAGEG